MPVQMSVQDLANFRLSPNDGSGLVLTRFAVPVTMSLTDALTALLATLTGIGCSFEVDVARGEVLLNEITVHGGHRVGGLVSVSDMGSSSKSSLVLSFMRRYGKEDSWTRLVYEIAEKASFANAADIPPYLRQPGRCVSCNANQNWTSGGIFGFFCDPDDGGAGGADSEDVFGGLFLPFHDPACTLADAVRRW